MQITQPTLRCQTLLSLFLFFSLSFSTTAQIPAGVIASYPLNNSATDIGGSGYNGTLSGVTATPNRFSNAGAATAFSGASSTGTLPAGLITAVQNDFSMGYWFKTSMVAATSAQWYGGNAMVDAEVCGQTNDWGTALIDGGKVALGIGNPDITIKSVSATYNNNAWHFVTVTRNASAASIALYVDGTAVASTTGTNTASLSSPSLLGLGRNPCAASGAFTGSLDDIIFYNRALSAAEVTSLYNALNAVALPVKWLSFTGSVSNNTLNLRWTVEETVSSDYFTVEQSPDGIYFSALLTLRSNVSAANSSQEQSYSLSLPATAGAAMYYRIQQVDKDGSQHYSKTIKPLGALPLGGLMLQTNPVQQTLQLVNSKQLLLQKLDVLDMSGRLLISKTVNASNTRLPLNIAALAPGFYSLRVHTATAQYLLPLVKQ